MKDSTIQWTDHTFNAWEGCTKVAPECKNCYAETLVDHRFGRAKWGKGQPRRRTSENLWNQPLRWNREAESKFQAWEALKQTHGASDALLVELGHIPPRRPRVFCLSLGDWLDEEVPIEWFHDLLDRIRVCTNLDWQLLTKRPQNWMPRMVQAMRHNEDSGGDPVHHAWMLDWVTSKSIGNPPANIWIGVSAGAGQKTALEIPAKVHFLSCEPMLHALDEEQNHVTQKFDWIIFGGESGKNARPCNIDWIRRGVEMCRFYGIAPFVKQFGARPFENHEPVDPTPEEERAWHRNGWCKISFADGSGRDPVWNKNYRLADSHGGDMSEWPEDLRVREFPQI